MWLCVDRIEGNIVVLQDDEEKLYRLSVTDFTKLTGIAPAESAILAAEVTDGHISAATYDEAETATRMAAARAQLDRLFGRG